jgi:hypothetical protein
MKVQIELSQPLVASNDTTLYAKGSVNKQEAKKTNEDRIQMWLGLIGQVLPYINRQSKKPNRYQISLAEFHQYTIFPHQHFYTRILKFIYNQ